MLVRAELINWESAGRKRKLWTDIGMELPDLKSLLLRFPVHRNFSEGREKC